MTEKTAKGRDLARGERLQIMLDQDELDTLDDFRFANRIPSRAAAVRELLKRGLTAIEQGSRRGASSSYGVIDHSVSNGHANGAEKGGK